MDKRFSDELRQILDSLGVGVSVHAPDGALLFANQAALNISGLRLREALAQPSLERGQATAPEAPLYSPGGEQIAAQDHPLSRALCAGEPVLGQVIGVRHDQTDELSWWQVSALPQRRPDGELSAVLCTYSNVSAQRDVMDELERDRLVAVADLARRELLYHAMVKSMSEGVLVLDVDGQIMEANPAAERLLNLKKDHLVGRYNTDPRFAMHNLEGERLSPEQVPSGITLRTGRSFQNYPLWIGAGPERVCLSTNTVPIAAPAGRRVVMTFTDITAQEQARTALEASKARYQRIVDAVPGLVFVLESTPKPNFTYLSAAAKDLLNLDPKRLPSPVRWETVHPNDRARIRATIESGVGPLDTEFRLLLKDQPPKWLQIKANPERVDGRCIWHGILVDVSERRLLESSLREAQRREVIGEMAAGIAHNFNNALSAVLPNLDIALSDSSGSTKEALEDARIAALSASELVSQLLLIARNEPQTEQQPLDLAQITRSATRILRSTLPANLGMRVSLCQEAPIIGHASQLQQVILNLVLNARDALIDQPHPQINITLKAAELRWELTVSDNGPGVPPQILQQLGKPFVTSKPPGQGTGLGLATVFSILEDHSGSLKIQSSPEGASFSVCLPMAEPSVPLPSIELDEPEERGLHILLVEDQELVRRALTRSLLRVGHTVVEASGGEQALELARAHLLDVVLLDLSMPGISGEEVLIKLTALYPSLPVVILSGYWDPDRNELRSAAAVLRKPPNLPELMQTLWRVTLDE